MRHAQRTLPEEPLSPELIARLREAQAHKFPADCKPSGSTFESARAKLKELRERRSANPP